MNKLKNLQENKAISNQLLQILGVKYQSIINTLQEAGKAILQLYDSDYQIEKKADHSKVTQADYLAQNIIIERLKSHYSYPIISEELNNFEILDEKTYWILDPIDGTNDFIQKTGEFCIMLALMQNKTPIMGFVYIPIKNKLIFANQGKGCFLLTHSQNQVQLTTLKVNSAQTLAHAKMAISRSHFREEELVYCEQKGLNQANFFPCGSIGVKSSLICEQTSDLYLNFSQRLGIWDVAPCEILLKEAGGFCTDIDGNAIEYTNQAKVHQKIIFSAIKL